MNKKTYFTVYLIQCKISFFICVVYFPPQRSVHFFHHKVHKVHKDVAWALRLFFRTQSVAYTLKYTTLCVLCALVRYSVVEKAITLRFVYSKKSEAITLRFVNFVHFCGGKSGRYVLRKTYYVYKKTYFTVYLIVGVTTPKPRQFC